MALGNGNLMYTVSQDTVNSRHTVRSETYTSFNMPSTLVYGNFITSTSSTADRTLGFVYGPEHQRIRQNINLTGSGTSAYFAGDIWYLNGEDSQGLSYEKEIRSNGTTEEKHYVSAAGVVFAMYTRRTGTLNGLPAASTSYFHHDQLGSISAITSETGAVVERLAYDPWGKRRFINTTPGLPDNLDAIVGVRTDRGFTMHEHLDEIGVIHMNGRIYDPLIARFMSADPFIQAPGNLQSFNRYAYAINNPLTVHDPSGFYFEMSDLDGTVQEFSGPANPNNQLQSEFGPSQGFNADVARSFVDAAYDKAPGLKSATYGLSEKALNAKSIGLQEFQSFVNSSNRALLGVSESNPGVAVAYSLVDSSVDLLTGGYGKLTAENLKKGSYLTGITYGIAGALVGASNFITGGASAGIRSAYSVAVEVAIPRSTGLAYRGAHKAAANKSLANKMNEDKEFAQVMKALDVQPQPGRLSPPGYNWHHPLDRPGILELVPSSQHPYAKEFQNALHPDGAGGWAQWGFNW